ncbi:MAG: class I SAM-dependent methyltransferase [Chitinophagaceae bacterium]|nr:class I SAM-dependent methyltransferase [Chitinophagaceae bacterium]
MNPSQPARPILYQEPVIPFHPVYHTVENYYEIAGPDYETWSPHFNMHFGYCRRFRDIFSLESMLQQMNAKVLEELQIDPLQPARIADLGCGMATVARYAAEHYPLSHLVAISIVEKHVAMAKELNKAAGLENQITVCRDNFENLHLSGNSITHAYAIESACHAASPNKQKFITELARILKPGGRFCIADGFLKSKQPSSGILNGSIRK